MNTIAAKPLLEPMAGVPRMGFSEAHVSYRGLSVSISYAFIEPAVTQSEEKKAVITFHLPIAVYIGLPNDEALDGHPLYSAGLESYRAYKVSGSAWFAEVVSRNSVHPSHRDEHFAGFHHFILTFKEEVFECIAKGFTVAFE